MNKLFLDVLGNKELVDGYQIEDAIAQKYNLQAGSICPFTGLRVEILSPEQVRAAEKAEHRKKIKEQRRSSGRKEQKQKRESHVPQKKKNPAAVDSKISGHAAEKKSKTKSSHPGESHDFARGRARSERGPVRRNRIFEKEEVRMATAKKVPAKPAKAAAKAPAKTKTPAKAPAKAAAKPAKAKAKAGAKAPVKAKAKAKAKAPVKAKAVAKKPAAKKPAAKKPAKAKK
jgi:hypothetical protein